MDLDVLKEIPGYKAILKSVIRSQIQLLIEQLSEHAGEEAVILTASLHDGTLSHLGSNTGKGFLEGRDEIKSQFLGYCLKSHHKKKTSEVRSSPYQRPSVQPASHRRARSQNVSTLQEGSNLDLFTPPEIHRAPSHPNGQNDTRVNIKLESSEQGTSRNQGSGYVADSATFPSSLQLSHTQTSSEHDSDDKNELQNNSNPENDNENDENTATSIKIEPITENEMELEITGVEPGKLSGDPESWGQGHSISANSDTAGGSDGDQSTYIEAKESIDLTSDDDNDTGLSSVVATIPNFTPAEGSYSFSVVDVSSLCSQASDMIPTFLYQQQPASTSTVDDHVKPSYAAQKSTKPTMPYFDMDSVDPSVTEDPAMYMPISIPINPHKDVQFNKEFYGRDKTRIVLKRHICPMCGKRLLKKSDLDRHMIVHTGDKPFFCPKCRQRFSQKRSFDLHRKKKQH